MGLLFAEAANDMKPIIRRSFGSSHSDQNLYSRIISRFTIYPPHFAAMAAGGALGVAAAEENKDKKRKADEKPAADAFADAQENLDSEPMDSDSTGSDSTRRIRSAFENKLDLFMADMRKGVADNTKTIDDNQKGITAVATQVVELKRDVNLRVDALATAQSKTATRLQTTCDNMAVLAKQILKLEQGPAVPHFRLSPRADPRGPDPLAVAANDAWAKGRKAAGETASARASSATPSAQAWQEFIGTQSKPSSSASPYQLEVKSGDRNTIIFGGFQQDTDKADIEEALREILEGTTGVQRITSLGKYASCGKVTFSDKEFMWSFIKAHKGRKFPYLDQPSALWFSIEKTDEERENSKKVAMMVRALVTHLIEVGKVEPEKAKERIEADYVRGVLVFRGEAPVLTTSEDTLISVRGPKPLAIRIIQKDKETGEYGVLEAGRGREEFKTFGWETLMIAVKEAKIITKW